MLEPSPVSDALDEVPARIVVLSVDDEVGCKVTVVPSVTMTRVVEPLSSEEEDVTRSVVEVSDVVRSLEELAELEVDSGKVVCTVIVVPSVTTTRVVESVSSEDDDDTA